MDSAHSETAITASQDVESVVLPFSLDDLERAVESSKGDDGMTSLEVAAKVGRNQGWVQERLRALVKSGSLVVGKGVRKSIDGRRMMITVYRKAG